MWFTFHTENKIKDIRQYNKSIRNCLREQHLLGVIVTDEIIK